MSIAGGTEAAAVAGMSVGDGGGKTTRRGWYVWGSSHRGVSGNLCICSLHALQAARRVFLAGGLSLKDIVCYLVGLCVYTSTVWSSNCGFLHCFHCFKLSL